MTKPEPLTNDELALVPQAANALTDLPRTLVLRLLATIKADRMCLRAEESSYMHTQPVMMEIRDRLERAGYGKPSNANTTWAMVHDACDEVERLRAQVLRMTDGLQAKAADLDKLRQQLEVAEKLVVKP